LVFEIHLTKVYVLADTVIVSYDCSYIQPNQRAVGKVYKQACFHYFNVNNKPTRILYRLIICSFVSVIPCLRNAEMKRFASLCKTTLSPKLSVLPLRSGFSKVNSCGRTIGERVRLPIIVGDPWRSLSTTQTPFVTLPSPSRILANREQIDL
jgi:hypothetical protein